MASILERGGKFIVRQRCITRKGWLSWSCPDRESAEIVKLEMEREKAFGRDWEPPKPRVVPCLEEVGAAYLQHLHRANRALNTLRRYGESLDLLLRFLHARDGRSPVRLDQLSTRVLEEGWEWLRDPATARHQRQRSRTTAKRIVDAWQRLWAWAAAHEDYAEVCPFPRTIKMGRFPRPTPVAPTWEELDALILALRNGQRAAQREWVLRLAYIVRFTGMRRMAALRLRWEDVDLDNAKLVIRSEVTKGGYGGRTIPLHPSLVQEVSGWGLRTGSLIQPPEAELTGRGHCDRSFRRAWNRAGIPSDRWHGQPIHCARKTIETEWTVLGVSQAVIDCFLGHAGVGTGRRHYLDQTRLWESMVDAVAQIPPVRVVSRVGPDGTLTLVKPVKP